MTFHRLLLPVLLALAPALQAQPHAPIDRAAVVARHAVRNTGLNPESALTVGNGDFAVTVDVTGLQSLERIYYDGGLPLETRNTWSWHSFPNPKGLRFEDTLAPVPFHGRQILYPIQQNTPAGRYYRENPQPMPLGQFQFTLYGEVLRSEDIAGVNQTLDLWTGIVTSKLLVRGQPLEVTTAAHGSAAVLAVQARSPLIASGELQVRVRFPYAYRTSIAHKPPFIWEQPERHRSTLTQVAAGHARIAREADGTRYDTELRWSTPAELVSASTPQLAAPHDYRLRATRGDTLAFTAAFADAEHPAIDETVDSTLASSKQAWRDYWTKGGMVDLSAATDPRAKEVERRTIQSLYLMRVNYGGSFPPAETGLQHLSWFGKHNSEVYVFHAAQFYQWGHVDLLEKGLAWYLGQLPKGIAQAKSEGFDGVRWPKMSGLDGRPTPGAINPYIIWNQPNPIYLAELVYRAKPTKETLQRYGELVAESAKFLASFAHRDPATGVYHLGPPLKNVSESTSVELVRNPTFEVAFWYYGLQVAQQWRERQGLAPDAKWADVIKNLAPLPQQDGRYLEIEGIRNLFGPGKRGAPSSMLLALGYLPATDKIDIETARRTFHAVHEQRGVDGGWVSWQMGQGALTAARLGEPDRAVAILGNTRAAAHFMPSGYSRRPRDPEGAVAYLPTNAAYLMAMGLMAGGWDAAPQGVAAPGFPKDGAWNVRAEGLLPLP
ncbi:hypothetical protein ACG02S_25680 [Roseateles sp. DC23W]|uniref:Uncharacterized protein n=1 Tax=Pelomonas dachongensis TaxID=3299029 RepID=A0ABW7EVA3_9BURK